jgi:hypothetical protein
MSDIMIIGESNDRGNLDRLLSRAGLNLSQPSALGLDKVDIPAEERLLPSARIIARPRPCPLCYS